MARIVFYCRVERRLLETVEFYRQDIDALRALGHDVVIATKLREIPATFDCLFIWWWTRAAVPVAFARALRRPSIVTGAFNFRLPEEFDGIDYLRRPSWQRWLIQYAVRRADLNVFINRLERDACSRYFEIESARFCPLVVHEEYFDADRREVERELAIFNLCWSQKSNLRRKGIPEIVHATALLAARGIGIPVYLAGHEGNGTRWLRDLIDRCGVSGQVVHLGELSRDEKLDMLGRCELYVQPSWYEGFGLAQAEAMASGACVVTCPTGAIEEVVGDAGVYVPPGDPAALADAIEDLVRRPELREALRQRARQRIRDEFSPARKRATLSRLLAEVLSTS